MEGTTKPRPAAPATPSLEDARDVRETAAGRSPRAYRVEHDTRYSYSSAAMTSEHVACLRPRDLPRQRTLRHRLDVAPAASTRSTRLDYFGNTVERFSVLRPHRELLVSASSLVEVTGGFEAPGSTPAWEDVREAFRYAKGAAGLPEAELLFPSPFVSVGEDAREYATPSFAPGTPLLEAALDLMHRMHEDFVFDPEATTVTTPVARVLAERRGVCQDLAHVMISCLRSHGLPARYVSGYLLTDPPPGQPRLLGADASHAWVSLHCPGTGWVDLDPTNDLLPDDRHVVIGWGRDYGDVCPLRGVFVGGADHRLSIAVSVIPLDDVALAAELDADVVEPTLALGGDEA